MKKAMILKDYQERKSLYKYILKDIETKVILIVYIKNSDLKYI